MPLLKTIEVKNKKKLNKLRIDGGKEFINEAFDKFYKKKGLYLNLLARIFQNRIYLSNVRGERFRKVKI